MRNIYIDTDILFAFAFAAVVYFFTIGLPLWIVVHFILKFW